MIRAERRAGLVEFERAEAVAGEEALLARHLLRPLGARRRGNCRHASIDPFVHDSVTTTGRDQSAGGAGRARACRQPGSAKRRVSVAFPQIARCSCEILPLCGMAIPHPAGFSSVSAWGACPACRLRCRPSSPACPATSARRSSRASSATATPSAASPARASACWRPGRSSTTSCSATRRPARGWTRALDGVDVAYYLIHSMEGAGGERSWTSSAARPRRSRAPRPPPACGGSSISAACCPPTARSSRHLASRLAVEQALLEAAPRVDRAARLDRRRRPLALVPVPRAADRAPAGARRCPRGATNRTQPIDGRDVLEYLAAAATVAPGTRRPRLGHRRPGRHELPANCSSGSPR